MILPCFANTHIGVTSPPPTSDTKTQKAELEKPLILLSEKTISALQDIIPSLEAAATQRQPLLTIAEDSLAAVKAPGFDSVSILKDDTILLDGEGQDQATGTINQIEWRCRPYQVRGHSKDKVGEKKDRFDNALDATRAVVEEGIVPGRGTALLEASKALDGLMLANFELG
ncbi:hypothetical protein PSTT_13639 [Puccinia striiformis]|uniref:Uncharacterized protein n=1 Tax=Puccinia striiformis TaxID=27350 RepID=A0A2S4UR65_9BASI|nr:hypothetical protein PSTT_13639 [Puccinia striiformis]